MALSVFSSSISFQSSCRGSFVINFRIRPISFNASSRKSEYLCGWSARSSIGWFQEDIGSHNAPAKNARGGLEGLDLCLLSGLIVSWSWMYLQGDRARLSARDGPGALSAGWAWKMATRWHELVGMQERGNESPRLAGGASSIAGMWKRWRNQEMVP